MWQKISEFFSVNGKRERQKKRLLKPEFEHLFTQTPVDKWVSLDLEMTGLNPKTDHILSIGAVHLEKTEQGLMIDTGNALSLVCRPPVMPTDETIVIHGLRPSDVENGLSYDEMLPILLNFIENRSIIGFCVAMDMAFINALVKPFLGINLPNPMIDVSQLHWQQQMKKDPNYVGQQKHLNQLLIEFDIPKLPAHDAVNDAIMTAMLFTHLHYGK